NSSEVDQLLSEPERDILKRVAEGKSNKTIAGELFTSEKTVERHLSSTYAKLNLEGRSKSLNPRVVASLRYLGLL
ncbi:MAG: response regulator transcription factor, partial [Ilumatobacteraceae bacterium]